MHNCIKVLSEQMKSKTFDHVHFYTLVLHVFAVRPRLASTLCDVKSLTQKSVNYHKASPYYRGL